MPLNVTEIRPGAMGQSPVVDQHGRKTGEGPPSGGGGMEPRIAKLESDVGHIQDDVREIKIDIRGMRNDAKEDFRILFGAIIVVALGLASLMGKAFGWL